MSTDPAEPGRRARDIFVAATNVPADERVDLLRERCGDDADLRREIDELLRFHDDGNGPLDRAAVDRPEEDPDARRSELRDRILPGTHIGQFVVEDLIGEGGMGVVYRCRQDRPRRVVAVKLIRPLFATPSVVRRFEREAEALGRVQHPGIACIIEAGSVTIGGVEQPYVAMEFVHGLPIDQFCATKVPEVAGRIELFLKVCDAVAHAHERGIIHRDIKPANVLVDSAGQPRILDFGVALATEGDLSAATRLTSERQLIGTLAYMSPEQASGEQASIDARADVYALGGTLVETLTGLPPIDLKGLPIGRAIQAILDGRQRRLADVHPSFKGDLDTIVAKALAPERDRRYQSVNAFAADLRRWLADEPIAARPPSTLYRLRKLAKRRRGLLVGIGIGLGAITVGGAVAIGALLREREARDRADIAALDRSEIAGVLTRLVRGIDPALAEGGETTALRGMLRQCQERIAEELHDQPGIQSDLLRTVADGFLSLGAYEDAQGVATQALESHRALDGTPSARAAEDLALLARIAMVRGELDKAHRLCDEALAERISLFGEAHTDVGASLVDMSDIVTLQGDAPQAESLLARAIAMHRASDRPVARERLAAALPKLAQCFARRQMFVESGDAIEESMRLAAALHGPRSAEMSDCLEQRADIALERHDIVSAERDLREALAMRTVALGADHSRTADLRQGLAQLASFRGDGAEAMRQSQAAIDSLRRSVGARSHAYAVALGRHGQMLAHDGRNAEAAEVFREALAIVDGADAGTSNTARTLRVELLGLLLIGHEYEKAWPLIVRQLDEDDRSRTIPPTDREQLLAESVEAAANVVWERASAGVTGAGRDEAEAIATEGIHRGTQLRERRASSAGFLHHSADALLGAALVARARIRSLAGDEQGRDASLVDLGEAERLLQAAYAGLTASKETAGLRIEGEAPTVAIERWTARLYWTWTAVQPGERAKRELATWQATRGGAMALEPVAVSAPSGRPAR